MTAACGDDDNCLKCAPDAVVGDSVVPADAAKPDAVVADAAPDAPVDAAVDAVIIL